MMSTSEPGPERGRGRGRDTEGPEETDGEGEWGDVEKSRLDGKQLWLIQAHKDVDAASITHLADGIITTTGGKQFLARGTETGVSSSLRVLVSEESTHGSKTPRRVEASTLPFARIVTISEIRDVPVSTQDGGNWHAPRVQQPCGLRMRFRPYGYGDDDQGDLGLDTEIHEPVPAEVAALERSKQKHRHKHRHEEKGGKEREEERDEEKDKGRDEEREKEREKEKRRKERHDHRAKRRRNETE